MNQHQELNRKILIIDDQQVIHDAFRKVFATGNSSTDALDDAEAALFGDAPSEQLTAKELHFDLSHTYQGEQGFAEVVAALERDEPYAVAFVDMRMPPGWDGLETIAKLLDADSELQVVMCTAYSDYTWSQVLTRIGYTDRLLLLKKPFSTEEAYQLAIALTEKHRLSLDYHRQLRAIEQSNTLLQREIEERRLAQQQLAVAATRDGLTNLPNRRLFVELLQEAFDRRDPQRGTFDAVLFVDVDNFKTVNDVMGHAAGDRLLVEVAERLQTCYRRTDSVSAATDDLPARLGGDEFVILVRDMKSRTELVAIADRLVTAMKQPILVDGSQISVTTSIGVAAIDSLVTSPDEVLRNADAAMYQAKLAGKDQIAVFDADMHTSIVRRMEIETALRSAVEHGELSLFYQPIHEVETCRLVGFEALLRWAHPLHGAISPSEFIPIAEETPSMVSVGKWVLEEACRQAAQWRDMYPEAAQLHLSVNVSRKQLVRPDFVTGVEELVARYPGIGSSLNFEVTESAVMTDAEIIVDVLKRVRQLGIRIHMDDFGTGHSSLSCLHRFPIDVLKIDRSFVSTMESNSDYEAVVHAIVSLAHHLQIAVIAEGVESPDQLESLQSLGCEFAQGYHFSRPLTAALAEEWIAKYTTDSTGQARAADSCATLETIEV